MSSIGVQTAKAPHKQVSFVNMLCAVISGWSCSRREFPLFSYSQADPWKESFRLIFFPQSVAILKAGLFCELVGMNQRTPFTPRQRVSENKVWAKAWCYVPALSPCAGGKMGGAGLRLSITQNVAGSWILFSTANHLLIPAAMHPSLVAPNIQWD